jgi:hypothetical protein
MAFSDPHLPVIARLGVVAEVEPAEGGLIGVLRFHWALTIAYPNKDSYFPETPRLSAQNEYSSHKYHVESWTGVSLRRGRDGFSCLH